MPGVRIVKVSHVNLSPDSCSSASKTIMPLSFFYIRWISFQPVQNLLLYPDARLYPSSFHSIKSSLAKTLSLFHTLAGTLAYLPASDDVVLDCSSDGGVAFVEAVSDIDVRRIAEDDVHDTGAFLKLVPEIAADEMPLPVLAVQVTAFVGGGAAVGVAIHHAAVDGRAFWQFVEAWAAECRGDCRAKQDPAPSHDRAVIAVPAKDAIGKRYLSFLAPNRPKLPPTSNKSLQDRLRLTRRTFTLNATAIQSLKRRAMLPLHEKRISPLSRTPSTFEALAAHSWVSLVLAKGLACDAAARDNPSFLFFLAGCRARLSLPVNAGYTGNCLRGIKVCATELDLTAPDGHARARAVIAQAVRAVEQEPVRGIEKWPEEFANLPPGIKVSVAGSPRQAGYATDFGWGRRGARVDELRRGGGAVQGKGRGHGAGIRRDRSTVDGGFCPSARERFGYHQAPQYSCIGRQIMMLQYLLKLLQSLHVTEYGLLVLKVSVHISFCGHIHISVFVILSS